ncbi:MAG: SpoVR family protein [Zavarzinella sp.]
MFYNTSLPSHLRLLKDEIEGYARDYGLDFFDTIFEVVDSDDLNEIAAYGGFPTRYPHWSFGMAYQELQKSYEYGLSKIYEMVINTDPSYAYLMRCNHTVDQKLVMAHVYGHVDFFKNNAYFAGTNRKMMDEMANHGARIRGYAERFGESNVEEFLDICMSIDDLIDIHSLAIKRHSDPHHVQAQQFEDAPSGAVRFKSKDYMDEYINPPEQAREEARPNQMKPELHFPDRPEKDVLMFLINHAPLHAWQRDVLEIVRNEAYYFYPQAQTKIINEGWASYWHSRIMTEKALHPSELLDYADHHSGTMAMSGGRLNPYKLGIELLRDIEERWNTGRFGEEYENCENLEEKRAWNKNLGLGRKKIFEVRRIHNDITLLDAYMTPEFCAKHKLFGFKYDDHSRQYVIDTRDFEAIKQKLLTSLTNFGKPWIYVVDGNFRNRSELLLRHQHQGVDLNEQEAQDVLVNLNKLWGRPVHVETVYDDHKMLLTFDGSEHSQEIIGDIDAEA